MNSINVTEQIKLTTTGAIDYRKYVANIIRDRQPWTSTNRIAGEFTKLHQRLETAFRQWITELRPTLASRVLKYMSISPVLNVHQWRFREMDCVCGSDLNHPECIIELKAPSKFRIKSKKQLEMTLELARSRWPSVRGIWVNLYLGSVLEVEATPPCRVLSGNEASEILKRNSSGNSESESQEIESLWVDGQEFIEMAIKRGWLPANFQKELRDLHQAVHPSRNTLRQYSDHRPLNSLGDIFPN